MKWRILCKAIDTHPDTADIIIKAVCNFHNIIIDRENLVNNIETEAPTDSAILLDIEATRRNNRASVDSVAVRNAFKEFFRRSL